MNRTSSGFLHLFLSQFSEELHRTDVEEALRSDNLRFLVMHLDNYNGVTNLDFFRLVLEHAPEKVILRGRPRNAF